MEATKQSKLKPSSLDDRKRAAEVDDFEVPAIKRPKYSSVSQRIMPSSLDDRKRAAEVDDYEVQATKRPKLEKYSFRPVSQKIMPSSLDDRKRAAEVDDSEVPAAKQAKLEKYSFRPVSQKITPSSLDDRKRAAEVDDSEVPAAKQAKLEKYSSVSQRIMASMGYRPGEGLGKTGSGMSTPVMESLQKGRRGLGYMLEGLEREDVQWEVEEIFCEEKPEWLEPYQLPLPVDFSEWMTTGERKESIEEETTFCDPNILQRVLSGKVHYKESVFDNLSDKEFLDARQRSNPFETIKGAIFQNRAAMKMANIDAVFGFVFTKPKKKDGSDLLGPHDVLYFADICAGPGGFSEYVLSRKKWHAKGFGLTLKDPNSGADFKLDQFLAAPCETFDPHYGVGGYDGDGDIARPENLEAFRDYVMEQTDFSGVHFVMADGGISVEGQENIQEILTKQLVLCQYTCALSVLREGGHFVCKVFDMFTPFSVGLFYLLYCCFRQVCLFKPVTSRPANSERYVVCLDLQPGYEVIYNYMYEVNLKLCKLNKEMPNMDVLEVVPIDILKEDEAFFAYVHAYNDSFGVNQALNLKKLQYFVKNPILQDTRQADIRRKCLELWKVSLSPRTVPSSEPTALQVFTDFWKQLTPPRSDQPADISMLDSANFKLVNKSSLGFLKDIHSWKWCWASGKRLMLVGLGRNKVYAWDMRGRKPMFSQRRELLGLEMPQGTVIEVELAQELQGEGRGQRKQDTLYIVDVIAIHGTLYGNKPQRERYLLAEKLCKVLNKPCRKGTILLKMKTLYRVTELPHYFSSGLSLKECKGRAAPIPTYQLGEEIFIAPVGVIFFKIIKDPWHLHLSRSRKLYYYNHESQESLFDCPPSSVAPYLTVLGSRHFWKWSREIFQDLCDESSEDTSDSGELTRSYFCKIIEHKE